MEKQFNVHVMIEIATALKAAAEAALDIGIEDIYAENGWQAIERVLEKHPEWPLLAGWIKLCLMDLEEGHHEAK